MALLTNKNETARYIEDNEVEFVDIRFTDLPGVQQHFNVPVDEFLDNYEAGFAFDGSSIRGFQSINESDMKLLPCPQTAYIDPFRNHVTLVVIMNVVDPFTNEPYSRDPRQVSMKAEKYLQETGIADTAFFAPEAEFYIFDDVRFETSAARSFYTIDSEEAAWNTGAEEVGGNLAHKPRFKGGYFPVPPVDHFADLRDEITARLAQTGLHIERAHHEVGTAGQQEINYRFNKLKFAADDVLRFKYVVKNTVNEFGKTATFLPKPISGDNGSGMHCHQSLWKNGENLFFESGKYGDLSDIARWYIGGLIKHAEAVIAFTNPTTNSYHRLVPGFEAPVNLVYSARNRSAAIRIPITGDNPKAKRIEFRVPDPSSNPYLAFAAQLMAGLDGILNHIEPPSPVDSNIYELSADQQLSIKHVPVSLEEALNALENDSEFLMKGNVFSKDLIETWLEFKRAEAAEFQTRPHPHEFELYYDC
ncbi:MAG: type I glutamate--ammonia ligase [Candidatus Ancillula sp.]|jgi:glutamine synthetase|nr:type I glutamate--ammonia ligase [Candidatus Ancillula sp.]